MTTFVLTVMEPSMERALAAVAAAPDSIDAIEIRIDALEEPPALEAFRKATTKKLILTRRSSERVQPLSAAEIQAAVDSGFDWIDVELADGMPDLSRFSQSLILSHHDFKGTPDTTALLRRMKTFPAARRKIAVSPRTFAENERVLTTLSVSSDPHLTMIGMGSRGLYSRMLGPFLGSELVFLAGDEATVAAPGQLTVSQAQAIYGRKPMTPAALFAVVGNPVGHSRSPEIHNPRFRQEGIAAAYAMIEVETFDEVTNAMTGSTPFAPAGISVTAPFKEDAYRFARSVNARFSERAVRCRAINTLVRVEGGFIADNTDVNGFAAGLKRNTGASAMTAALIGAGGAARAALVALQDAGIHATIFNRTLQKASSLATEFGAEAKQLGELEGFRADIVINALPANVSIEIPHAALYIDVAYGLEAEERIGPVREAGTMVFDGMDFLRAQAVPQFELFARTSGVPV